MQWPTRAMWSPPFAGVSRLGLREWSTVSDDSRGWTSARRHVRPRCSRRGTCSTQPRQRNDQVPRSGVAGAGDQVAGQDDSLEHLLAPHRRPRCRPGGLAATAIDAAEEVVEATRTRSRPRRQDLVSRRQMRSGLSIPIARSERPTARWILGIERHSARSARSERYQGAN
jgi:hypothetical protein